MQNDPARAQVTESRKSDWPFYFRLLLLAGAMVSAALLVWQLATLLLLAFAAVLVAVLLRSSASLIERYTPLRSKISLALATLVIAALIAGFVMLLGAQIQEQFRQLTERLPELIAAVEDRLGMEDLERTLARRGPAID